MNADLPSTYPLGNAMYLEACYQRDIAYMQERYFDHYGTMTGFRKMSRRTWWRSLWAESVREVYAMIGDHSRERV